MLKGVMGGGAAGKGLKGIKSVAQNALANGEAMLRARRDANAGKKYDKLRMMIKSARAYDNASSRNENGITDAGKARFMAETGKEDYLAAQKGKKGLFGDYRR